MRVLLNFKWRGDEVAKKLEEAGHEVVYLIALEREKAKRAVPNAFFHNKKDAQRGIFPDEYDSLDFSTPDKDLLERLYETESIILTMMNRRESRLSVEERKHIYYEHVRYWSGILDKLKIEAVIFDDVPHAINTFIILSLAKLKGIKTLMLQKIRFSDRFLLFDDWFNGGKKVLDRYEKIKHEEFSVNDLPEDIKSVYLEHSKETEKALYSLKAFEIKKNRIDLRKIINKFFVNPLRAILNGSFIKLSYKKINRRKLIKQAKEMIAEHNRYQQIPDFNEKFIYFGLQYQPERTTCPQGDVFVDQILAIEYLASAIPADWKIYVKEHPVQWRDDKLETGSRVRYPGYYKRIANLKNVILVPIESNSLKLVNKAEIIATITGSMGLEAVMRGKPALVFGRPWYLGAPGVFLIKSVKDIKVVIDNLLMNKKVFDKQKLINYLKAFADVSFHGYIGIKTFLGTESKLKEEESMNEIYKHILEELK